MDVSIKDLRRALPKFSALQIIELERLIQDHKRRHPGDSANRAAPVVPEKENDDLGHAVFHHSLDGIFISSPSGAIFSANPAACRLLGLSEAEFIRLGRSGIVELSDVRSQNALRQLEQTGTFQGEVVFRRQDGARLLVEVSTSSFFDRNGMPRRVVIFRDRTEEQHTRGLLKENEERFRLTFDQSPIGAAIVSLDYRFVRVNESLCRITGYSENELLSLRFSDITYPDDLQADVEQAEALKKGERDRYSMEKRYIQKLGSVVWVRLTASILRDADRPLYYLALIEDIQDRKCAEIEREQLIQKLQEALADVKTLKGLLPICAWCKKIRDDSGYWNQMETYIMRHSQAEFTHSICEDCLRKQVAIVAAEIGGKEYR
jgi:PAS domain S-box-containing protein